MFNLPPTEGSLDLHLNVWAIKETNRKISQLKLPCVDHITEFSRQNYVYEHGELSTIAQFRLSCAGLGNKAPNIAGFRSRHCILCSKDLNEQHVAFSCPELEKFRRTHTSISTFRNHCKLVSNDSLDTSYKKFVNGQDVHGVVITRSDHKSRGCMLSVMKNAWLRMAGYKTVFHSLRLFILPLDTIFYFYPLLSFFSLFFSFHLHRLRDYHSV